MAKNKGGRPKKFNAAEEIQIKIDKYFEDCDLKKKPYTISGLAYALEVDRQTLLNYQKDSEFFGTIKRAKQKCEIFAEETLFSAGKTAGAIFNLINNYKDWSNKTEVDNNITGFQGITITTSKSKKGKKDD